MTLLSRYDGPPPPPEKLGPVASGMRRIVLTCPMNLALCRGERNEILDVEETVARDMLQLGNAVYFDLEILARQEKLVKPVDEDGEDLERPKPYHSKADWVTWAVACGADEEAANDMTKAQLQNDYSERL